MSMSDILHLNKKLISVEVVSESALAKDNYFLLKFADKSVLKLGVSEWIGDMEWVVGVVK